MSGKQKVFYKHHDMHGRELFQGDIIAIGSGNEIVMCRIIASTKTLVRVKSLHKGSYYSDNGFLTRPNFAIKQDSEYAMLWVLKNSK